MGLYKFRGHNKTKLKQSNSFGSFLQSCQLLSKLCYFLPFQRCFDFKSNVNVSYSVEIKTSIRLCPNNLNLLFSEKNLQQNFQEFCRRFTCEFKVQAHIPFLDNLFTKRQLLTSKLLFRFFSNYRVRNFCR